MNAVIFDMDGLMFDTEKIFIQAWDFVGEKLGVGKAGFMALKTLGVNLKTAEKMWLDEFDNKIDINKLRDYTIEFFESYSLNNNLPVKKGLYNLLNYLQKMNYKLAVASSSPQKLVLDNLNSTNTKKYFSAIICGDMVEKSKPEPDIYLEACNALGENPSNCYALEDSKNGLFAAYNAGCKAIMIPDLWQPDIETLQIITAKLNDLDEVINFLKVGENLE